MLRVTLGLVGRGAPPGRDWATGVAGSAGARRGRTGLLAPPGRRVTPALPGLPVPLGLMGLLAPPGRRVTPALPGLPVPLAPPGQRLPAALPGLPVPLGLPGPAGPAGPQGPKGDAGFSGLITVAGGTASGDKQFTVNCPLNVSTPNPNDRWKRSAAGSTSRVR